MKVFNRRMSIFDAFRRGFRAARAEGAAQADYAAAKGRVDDIRDFWFAPEVAPQCAPEYSWARSSIENICLLV